MKSKKHDEDEGHENGERWLLTYSDLITLLLALFIILYSISQIDAKKYNAFSEAMQEALNNTKTSVTTGGKDTGSKEGASTTKATTKKGDGDTTKPLDKIYKELNAYIQQNNLQNQIELENTDTYVIVRLKDGLLFVPDKSTMLDNCKPILLEIEKAVAGVYADIDHITISGHTADPDNTQGDYSSAFAWQLSSARAYTVLQYFIDNGLPQNKLSIEGSSRFDPIADNKTEEGRAKNRRVEIMVVKNTATQSAPIYSSTTTAKESSTTTTKKSESTTKASSKSSK